MAPPRRHNRRVKFLAATLSCVFTFTQVLFAHVPTLSVWETRRAVQPHRIDDRLACLMDAPPLPSALPSAAKLASVPSRFSAATPSDSLLKLLPPDIVTVRGILASSSSGPLAGRRIIVVQDVHMNAEAQRNIADLLFRLMGAGEAGLVAVEGAVGVFDLARFRRYPDKSITDAVARAFLVANRIGAPSFAGITSKTEPPLFWGVDDAEHYDRNVDAYREGLKDQVAVRKSLAAESGALAQAKRVAFTPALAALDADAAAYDAGSRGLGEHLQFLSAQGAVSVLSPDARAMVDRFLEAWRIEKSLDFDRADRERRAALETLVARLSKDEIDGLVALSLAYRDGRVGFGTYHGAIASLLERKGVSLERLPAFRSYLRYVLLSDGIQADRLISAAQEAESFAFRSAATTDEERRLVSASRRLALEKKLIDFSLTPQEWGEYAQLVSAGPKPPRLVPFENFYREADTRSERIVDNLARAAEGTDRSKVAVLIVGGFHAPDVVRRLHDLGASIATVSPKLAKVDAAGGTAYLSVFSREKTPLEKLFQGEKLFVYPAFLDISANGPHTDGPNQTFQDAQELGSEIGAAAIDRAPMEFLARAQRRHLPRRVYRSVRATLRSARQRIPAAPLQMGALWNWLGAKLGLSPEMRARLSLVEEFIYVGLLVYVLPWVLASTGAIAWTSVPDVQKGMFVVANLWFARDHTERFTWTKDGKIESRPAGAGTFLTSLVVGTAFRSLFFFGYGPGAVLIVGAVAHGIWNNLLAPFIRILPVMMTSVYVPKFLRSEPQTLKDRLYELSLNMDMAFHADAKALYRRLAALQETDWLPADRQAVEALLARAETAFDPARGYIATKSEHAPKFAGHPIYMYSAEGRIAAWALPPNETTDFSFVEEDRDQVEVSQGGLGDLFGGRKDSISDVGFVTTFDPRSVAANAYVFIPWYSEGIRVSILDEFGYPLPEKDPRIWQHQGMKFPRLADPNNTAVPLTVTVPDPLLGDVPVQFVVIPKNGMMTILPTTDVPVQAGNGVAAEKQKILSKVYSGGLSSLERFRQHWVFGIATQKAREAYHLPPGPMETNETATVIPVVGRIKEVVEQYMAAGRSLPDAYELALETVGPELIFFSHTLVVAGLDKFYSNVPVMEFFRQYFAESPAIRAASVDGKDGASAMAEWMIKGRYSKALGMELPHFEFKEGRRMENGVVVPDAPHFSAFNFATTMIYTFNGQLEAVSRNNARKVEEMLSSPMYPVIKDPAVFEEKPVGSVANPIDERYFNTPELVALLDIENVDPAERHIYRLLDPKDPHANHVHRLATNRDMPAHYTEAAMTKDDIVRLKDGKRKLAVNMIRWIKRKSLIQAIETLRLAAASNPTEFNMKRLDALLRQWRLYSGTDYPNDPIAAAKVEFTHLLDPHRFTTTWARRMVEYKRPLLLMFGRNLPLLSEGIRAAAEAQNLRARGPVEHDRIVREMLSPLRPDHPGADQQRFEILVEQAKGFDYFDPVERDAYVRTLLEVLRHKLGYSSYEEMFARFRSHIHDDNTQFVFAGPTFDFFGGLNVGIFNTVIEQLSQNDPEIARRAVFLEKYDPFVSKILSLGSDLWLNTPAPYEEADGTSTKKPLKNKVSTLDGNAADGLFDGINGLAIHSPSDLHRRDHPMTWSKAERIQFADEERRYYEVEEQSLDDAMHRASRMFYDRASDDWINLLRRTGFYELEVYSARNATLGRWMPSADETISRPGPEPGLVDLYATSIDNMALARRGIALRQGGMRFVSKVPAVVSTPDGKVAAFALVQVAEGQDLPTVEFHWGPVSTHGATVKWKDRPAESVTRTGVQNVYLVSAMLTPETDGNYGVTAFAVPNGAGSTAAAPVLKIWQGGPGQNARFTRSEGKTAVPGASAFWRRWALFNPDKTGSALSRIAHVESWVLGMAALLALALLLPQAPPPIFSSFSLLAGFSLLVTFAVAFPIAFFLHFRYGVLLPDGSVVGPGLPLRERARVSLLASLAAMAPLLIIAPLLGLGLAHGIGPEQAWNFYLAPALGFAGLLFLTGAAHAEYNEAIRKSLGGSYEAPARSRLLSLRLLPTLITLTLLTAAAIPSAPLAEPLSVAATVLIGSMSIARDSAVQPDGRRVWSPAFPLIGMFNLMEEGARLVWDAERGVYRVSYGSSWKRFQEETLPHLPAGMTGVYFYGGFWPMSPLSAGVHQQPDSQGHVIRSGAASVHVHGYPGPHWFRDMTHAALGLAPETPWNPLVIDLDESGQPFGNRLEIRNDKGNPFSARRGWIAGPDGRPVLHINPRLASDGTAATSLAEAREVIRLLHEKGIRFFTDFFGWLSPDDIDASNYRMTFWQELPEADLRRWRQLDGQPEEQERFIDEIQNRYKWIESDGKWIHVPENEFYAIVRITEADADGVVRTRPIRVRHLSTGYGANKDEIVLNVLEPQTQTYLRTLLTLMIDLGIDGARIDLGHLLLLVEQEAFSTDPYGDPKKNEKDLDAYREKRELAMQGMKKEPIQDLLDRSRMYAAQRGRDFTFFMETYDEAHRATFRGWKVRVYFKGVLDTFRILLARKAEFMAVHGGHSPHSVRNAQRGRMEEVLQWMRGAFEHAWATIPFSLLFLSNFDEQSILNNGGPWQAPFVLNLLSAMAGAPFAVDNRGLSARRGQLSAIPGWDHPPATESDVAQHLTTPMSETYATSAVTRLLRQFNVVSGVRGVEPSGRVIGETLQTLDTDAQFRYVAAGARYSHPNLASPRWIVAVADFVPEWEHAPLRWVQAPADFVNETGLAAEASGRELTPGESAVIEQINKDYELVYFTPNPTGDGLVEHTRPLHFFVNVIGRQRYYRFGLPAEGAANEMPVFFIRSKQPFEVPVAPGLSGRWASSPLSLTAKTTVEGVVIGGTVLGLMTAFFAIFAAFFGVQLHVSDGAALAVLSSVLAAAVTGALILREHLRQGVLQPNGSVAVDVRTAVRASLVAARSLLSTPFFATALVLLKFSSVSPWIGVTLLAAGAVVAVVPHLRANLKIFGAAAPAPLDRRDYPIVSRAGPLLSTGRTAEGRVRDAKDPSVVFSGNRWHLYGTQDRSQGTPYHAVAQNPKGPFTNIGTIELLRADGTPYPGRVEAPGVVFDPQTRMFHLFAQTSFNSLGGDLVHFVSADGQVFRYQGVALHSDPSLGEAGLYDAHPMVLPDGRLALTYAAMEHVAGDYSWADPDIYLATANDWNGPWTRQGRIMSHADIPFHNQRGATDYEWGLEGPEILPLPVDGGYKYLLVGTAFLAGEAPGHRQRVFLAVADRPEGPYSQPTPVIDPALDAAWASGENGHASAAVVNGRHGPQLLLYYQARGGNERPWNVAVAQISLSPLIGPGAIPANTANGTTAAQSSARLAPSAGNAAESRLTARDIADAEHLAGMLRELNDARRAEDNARIAAAIAGLNALERMNLEFFGREAQLASRSDADVERQAATHPGAFAEWQFALRSAGRSEGNFAAGTVGGFIAGHTEIAANGDVDESRRDHVAIVASGADESAVAKETDEALVVADGRPLTVILPLPASDGETPADESARALQALAAALGSRYAGRQVRFLTETDFNRPGADPEAADQAVEDLLLKPALQDAGKLKLLVNRDAGLPDFLVRPLLALGRQDRYRDLVQLVIVTALSNGAFAVRASLDDIERAVEFRNLVLKQA